tara:strand:- start:6559 stop:7266 length:708 start_codon:yes stop_codon:yes gene_type:complete
MILPIYLFDVDGTLTPPRQAMKENFSSFFEEWMKNKKVYLISGSDYHKLEEQVPFPILKGVSGVFGCMGNTFHLAGHSISRRDYTPSEELLAFLEEKLAHSEYVLRCGNHIEKRVGMINFSIVGRNASISQRHAYHLYDEKTQEREQIAEEIKEQFPHLNAVVGGEISIDIFPEGADKSQILNHLPRGNYIFFGDKTNPGGNDYALAHALEERKFKVHGVKNYNETWTILQKEEG